MITINLLPEEFRVKEKAKLKIPGLPIILIFSGFFLIMTGILYLDYLHSNIRYAELQKEWGIIQPKSNQVKRVKDEIEKTIKAEEMFFNTSITTDKPITQVLSGLSENLPETAWLIELRVDRAADKVRIFLKGLVLPSEEKSSIELIENYLRQFKEEIGGAAMNLTTTRQKMGEANLTLFTANLEWNAVAPAAAVNPS